MTEQLKNHDFLHELDQLELPEHTKSVETTHETRVLSPDKTREAVAEAMQVETQSDARDKLTAAAKTSEEAPRTDVNSELRSISVRRELKNLQRKEKVPVRAFSQLVHAPVIRQVSELAGSTVSRPSGMLGAGLTALVGTSGYLYLARHIGFQYNYLIFLLLLAGGFIIGLVLEAAVHVATASRRKG